MTGDKIMDRILIVDDEAYIREELATIIEKPDREILFAQTGTVALDILSQQRVDVVLTDIRMPEMDGFEFIRRAREKWPSLIIITITAYASTETAVQALRAGAYDYVTKPFSIDEIRNIVNHAMQAHHLFNEVNYLRGRLKEEYSLDNIIGQCPAMSRVFSTISQVAQAQCSVLITGESGTGKDLVAQAIHEHSGRSGKFVPINCGSIPEGLLESELFGHVKGSFSGAIREKEGLVQTAHGGTLFLDEIGDMPPALQVKLLRMIQHKQVQKVGSTVQEDVDVRIIAATNQQLKDRIAQKAFREDLYYRINVVEIVLPPLRERGSDISLLTSHFIRKYSQRLDKQVEGLDSHVETLYLRYPWPGNIRELENAVERAVTLCRGPVIGIEDIPAAIADYCEESMIAQGTLSDRVSAFESEMIRRCLESHGNDYAAAAGELDISLATLYRKIKKAPPKTRQAISELKDHPLAGRISDAARTL